MKIWVSKGTSSISLILVLFYALKDKFQVASYPDTSTNLNFLQYKIVSWLISGCDQFYIPLPPHLGKP